MKKIEIIHKKFIKGKSNHVLWITFRKNKLNLTVIHKQMFWSEIAEYKEVYLSVLLNSSLA